jgi:hypothetical protein
MTDTSKIREHMEVVGSDGQHVGRVDKVEGVSLKLAMDASEASGEHRYIPVEWVASVNTSVHLSKPAMTVQQEWQAHAVKEGEYPPDA